MKAGSAGISAVLLGLLLLTNRGTTEEAEPAYLGKPMSHWLTLLLEQAKDPKKPEAEWSRAPMALAHIGHPAVSGVVLALHDPSPSTRRRAATCLLAMESHPEEANPALLTALKDNESAVRRTAAAALGASSTGTPEVVSGLTNALKDTEALVRESAVTSLGRLRAETAIPALEATASDPNAAVRAAGRKALERIRTAPVGAAH